MAEAGCALWVLAAFHVMIGKLCASSSLLPIRATRSDSANLGVMYSEGLAGLRKDEREAVRHWKLAAAQGDPGAQRELTRLGERW
jgi:hypothetical protein